MITLALSKGRIFDETLPLLAAAGIEVAEDPEKSRKLIIGTNRPDVRVVLVRASDVPTYVQHGGADLGVTGKDTLIEHGGEGLYQPLDLQIATLPHERRGARRFRLRQCGAARVRGSASRPSTRRSRASISPTRACMST